MQYADYSGGRPSAAALKAAGFSGVVRYVGLGSPGKLLTASEYRDLTAGGLDVLLVAELGTGDSWGSSTDDDYGRGRANATAGLNHAKNCGVPDSKLFIFGASDAHTSAQWQINDTIDYMRGFRDVLGWSREGHYGFSDTNIAVHNSGVSSGFWRCGSQPSTADKAWVNLWQRNVAPSTRVVSGVVCDINELYRSPLQEEDMSLSDTDIDKFVEAMRKRVIATEHDPNDPNANTDKVWTIGGRNFWDTVADARNRTEAIQNTLTDLVLKVAAQQNVPLADLVAGLLAGLLPEVKADLADVQHLDENAVADRLAANLAARLAQRPSL